MFEQPFAIPALILGVLAIPLIFGLVPRNRYYGVRTTRTLASADMWYSVNRRCGAAVIVAGAIYGGVASLMPYHRQSVDNFGTWAIHLAAWVVPLVLGLVVTMRSSAREFGP